MHLLHSQHKIIQWEQQNQPQRQKFHVWRTPDPLKTPLSISLRMPQFPSLLLPMNAVSVVHAC